MSAAVRQALEARSDFEQIIGALRARGVIGRSPGDPFAGVSLFRGRGCPQCNGRGTRGRTAVVEFLQINGELRDVISLQPPLGELRWRALDAGLVTMRDSALELVLQGVIPLSELPRILPEERLAPEQRGGIRSSE